MKTKKELLQEFREFLVIVQGREDLESFISNAIDATEERVLETVKKIEIQNSIDEFNKKRG